MNVARAPFHCIGEYQVHQLDDRSFVGRLLQFGQLHLRLFRLQFHVGIVQLIHGLHYGFEIFVLSGSVGLLDAHLNRAFRSHDRLDVEASHELDVVHRKHIGGIHHGDGQRCADTA